MVLFGFIYAAWNGNVQDAAQAALAAGDEAIETVLSLAGGFMFFGGITKVLELSGASIAVTNKLKRPLRFLFGKGVSDEALRAITINMTANMMGMGNAATPAGLNAARQLNPHKSDSAPAALCLLLVLNSTAIEFFPATVVALRYGAGSSSATAIVLPTLVSTAVSTLIGILLCKICERGTKK